MTEQSTPSECKSTTSLARFDLSGNRIRRWTIRARDKLVSALRRVLAFAKRGAETQLPGSSGSLGDKGKTLPGRTVEFLESAIEKTPIENQLKSAQTETEFLKQELIRQQIAKTAAETKGQQLDNVTKELEIRDRIQQIVAGRTEIHVFEDGEATIIVFGNLPLIPEEGDSDPSA